MICTTCHFYDALPGSTVCERCTPRNAAEMPTAKQWKLMAAKERELSDMLLRARERDLETIHLLSRLLSEVEGERETLQAELDALKAQVQA